MNSRYTNFFRVFFCFMDIGALNIVHLLILVLYPAAVSDGFKYMLLFAVMNMSWLGCSYFTGLYINDSQLNFERFARKTAQAFLLFIVSVLFYIFLFKYNYSRLFMLLSFASFGITLVIIRGFFILWASHYASSERFIRKIVVLGYNEVSKKLVSHFTANMKNISVKGYFEDYQKVKELSAFPIIGHFGECVSYAISNQVTEIYCTIAPEKDPSIYELAQDAEQNFIRFMFVPDLKLFVNRTIHFNYLEDIPILSLRYEPLQDVAGQIKKRIFDIFFSLLVIVLIMPWLLPVIALLIKLESNGPVFFVQLRSGKSNQSFHCYKFRSLRMNSEADSKQVTQNDDRFTRLGRFMRRTNIDELPQFFNVLLGDMSVIGPRPHMLKHTEMYAGLLNQYMVRHFLKPGITGWAQVNGLRGETKTVSQMQQRVEHDIWYIENWSLWLDFRIILLTMYNAFRGEKNAF
jgi:putative colanic acid biosynthesis UDP-glucose lipid carrier transferase